MKIEYFYSLASPFSFFGSEKFQTIAKIHNVEIVEKPCDLVGGIFSKTGGVPVPQRSAQRQKYRLDELKRWSEFLNIKINIKPKFFPPKDPHIPAKYTIAANLLGVKILFGHELLKKLWIEEKDISDEKNIELISNQFKIDFNELSSLAKSNKVSDIYTNNTEEAVQKNVFGAPTYIFNDELFWGQDRLEFLERALKKF
jgi:2-hydroxychromene-2-carboxylate isomerase